MAAGTFGWATQDEVASLRSTIQTLEDQLASLEAKTSLASQPSAPAKSGPSFSKPGPSRQCRSVRGPLCSGRRKGAPRVAGR